MNVPMKTNRVFCNGFWSGFVENTDGTKFSVFRDLLRGVFGEEEDFVPTSSAEEANIFIETHFMKESFRQKKSEALSIFFSGEGLWDYPEDINEYDLILGTRPRNLNEIGLLKYVEFPLFLAYELSSPFEYCVTENRRLPQKEMCAILSSEKYDSGNSERRKRTQLVETIVNQGKFQIDQAGRYLNNMPGGFTVPGSYFTPEILEFQSQYKFVLAFENCQEDEYITEKVINPIRANTIPIYFGSREVNRYINHERIIQIKDPGNLEECDKVFTEIRFLIENEEAWLEKIKKQIFITPPAVMFRNIINQVKKVLLLKRNFYVELICNTDVASEASRLPIVNKICKYFKILPSYHVWGEDAVKNHRYNHRLDSRSSMTEKSLTLNYIEKFESFRRLISSTNVKSSHVLFLESDVSPLYNLEYIDEKIEQIVSTMKKESIDFVFVGRGCFGIDNPELFEVSVNSKNLSFGCSLKDVQVYSLGENENRHLYETGLTRCTEAFIVSFEGMRKFLEHFHEYNHPEGVGKIAIDWELNHFFKVSSSNVKVCWCIPELFMQASADDGNIAKTRVYSYL